MSRPAAPPNPIRDSSASVHKADQKDKTMQGGVYGKTAIANSHCPKGNNKMQQPIYLIFPCSYLVSTRLEDIQEHYSGLYIPPRLASDGRENGITIEPVAL